MYFCIATVPKVLEEYKVRACIQFRKFIILANHAFIKNSTNFDLSVGYSLSHYTILALGSLHFKFIRYRVVGGILDVE